MKFSRLPVFCFLWILSLSPLNANAQSITNPFDMDMNIDITWIQVDSHNGATYEQFSALYKLQLDAYAQVIAFEFTEDVNYHVPYICCEPYNNIYTVTSPINVPTSGFLGLKTAPGVKVIFNLELNTDFIQMND